ncbi:MAG: PEGA domain-containing protein [Chitinispirillales bacterium]|jgi:hypothetical protein|nr:PEGA domain-containing protein [Chitinispirillales bacterium]
MRTFLLVFALISLPYASTGEFGKLRVDTDPPGADVVVVAEIGKTPISNDFMNPGLYKIEIRHPDGRYLPVAMEATIVAGGQPVTITHTLVKPPILTKRNGYQLILGAAAAAGVIWAAVDDDSFRRPAAAAAAGILQAALMVTIVLW